MVCIVSPSRRSLPPSSLRRSASFASDSPPPRRLRRLAPAGRSSLASGTVRSPSHGCGCVLFTVVNLFARPWFWASMPPCDALLLRTRAAGTNDAPTAPRRTIRRTTATQPAASHARVCRSSHCPVLVLRAFVVALLLLLNRTSASRLIHQSIVKSHKVQV